MLNFGKGQEKNHNEAIFNKYMAEKTKEFYENLEKFRKGDISGWSEEKIDLFTSAMQKDGITDGSLLIDFAFLPFAAARMAVSGIKLSSKLLIGVINSAKKYGIRNGKRLRFFAGARFKKISVNSGRQGKHIAGHNNFKPGKSEFTHKNLKKLIDDHGGRGKWYGDNKEIVNFGEDIGVWVGRDGTRLKTTRGTIHYDNSGSAHIVPAHPIGK